MLNQAQKKFVDLLSKVDYSTRLYEVFYDFCTLGTYSLALPFYRELASAEFKKVSEKYNRDQLTMFDKAFSIMVEDMEVSGGDFLGVIYGECEFGNSRQGQFFTPYNVSLMMAKMTFTGVKDRIQNQGYITVNEPACGSGGMLIAVRQAMIEEGCNPSRDMLIVAQDISDIAFMMSYIQLSLYGLAGKVVHGNTITMEIFRELYTPVYFLAGWPLWIATKSLFADPEQIEREESRSDGRDIQLKLF